LQKTREEIDFESDIENCDLKNVDALEIKNYFNDFIAQKPKEGCIIMNNMIQQQIRSVKEAIEPI
jgi:hypothetical protein